jgi:hypothetical protein
MIVAGEEGLPHLKELTMLRVRLALFLAHKKILRTVEMTLEFFVLSSPKQGDGYLVFLLAQEFETFNGCDISNVLQLINSECIC